MESVGEVWGCVEEVRKGKEDIRRFVIEYIMLSFCCSFVVKAAKKCPKEASKFLM